MSGGNRVTVEAFNQNPSGGSDPWLSNGARQTAGNNVDAYTDDNAPDGFSNNDIRALTTSPNTFDWMYNLFEGPVSSEEQSMASIVSLFYINNYLHDYWYDSGFNEAAGNAQQNNFGRGGLGGDPLRAEAQDGHFSGARNNANMSTPSDGMSPRMQMYTWTGSSQLDLTVSSGIAGSIEVNAAAFGPDTFNVTASLVVANDGTANPTDGCSALQNNVSGAIVLIDRGNCNFTEKTLSAQQAGAVGVLIANNTGGAPPFMGGSASTSITIGTLSIRQSDGNALKTALAAGTITATMRRQSNPDRAGSLDYGVVAHEWGHYLHNRLADCGSTQCRGMGEGWADMLTLHTALRAGDDLDGGYAVGLWATRGRRENSAYFGIRRAPYSVDPSKNAFSFRHIANGQALPSHPLQTNSNPNAQVHNTGTIWASMLFEGYVALLRPTETSTSPSFEMVRRRFANYIVSGLMLTPRDATFTEQRDAILAAASAQSPQDMLTLAEAFARRGAGSCAVSPPRNATTNAPVVESTELKPTLAIGPVHIDDSRLSCDGDGQLDAEEEGLVSLTIANAGPIAATNTQVVLTSTVSGIVFPAGPQITLPTIDAFGEAKVTLPIEVASFVSAITPLSLLVRSDNPDACQSTVTSTVVARINLDVVSGLTMDDVEAEATAWTTTGQNRSTVWSRTEVAPLQTAWRGLNFGTQSDTALVSPPLDVGGSNFSVQLKHRYRFEADEPDGSETNWDGAVVEISADGGVTWEDVEAYTNPGYRGTLTDRSGNPLGDREALVGTSPGFPAYQPLDLDFGTSFANQQVQLRFRIGSDAAVGDFGLEIDDIEVFGLTNAPFFGLVSDQTVCPIPLIADAGLDTEAQAEEVVRLDGSGSISSTQLPLSFRWTQLQGPRVTLEDSSTEAPFWVAPPLAQTETLEFLLEVDDGTLTATDTVGVTVRALDGPMAQAGVDARVEPGAAVILDGSMSTWDARLATNFAWTQRSGPTVNLQAKNALVAGFQAPISETELALEFELALFDEVRTSTDAVTILVDATPPLEALVAVAGEDQSVSDGDIVVLDGTQSAGDPRFPIAFSWTQTAGPEVKFVSDGGATAVFTAVGMISEEVELTFVLTARDERRSATDSLNVRIEALPAPPLPPTPNDDGCSCHLPDRSIHRTTLGLLILIGLVMTLRRRQYIGAVPLRFDEGVLSPAAERQGAERKTATSSSKGAGHATEESGP